MEEKTFEIPGKAGPPKSLEPRSMIIYSAPKVGKTALTAQIPDSIIVEHEIGGADAVSARYIEITNPNDILPLLAQLALDETINTIVIDTVTRWDEWSELTGTFAFQKKPQGKNWNVVKGKRVGSKHAAFETVHAMGEGFGYRYSRNEMTTWFNAAIRTGKRVIFLAHIKDKFIEAKSGDVVEAIDLNLTGKVKSIYSSKVDVIAHLKRSGNESYLNFENMGSSVSGSRYGYLKGSILIGESDKAGVLTTHWDSIFPSLKKK